VDRHTDLAFIGDEGLTIQFMKPRPSAPYIMEQKEIKSSEKEENPRAKHVSNGQETKG
jgi:hypothetical protein